MQKPMSVAQVKVRRREIVKPPRRRWQGIFILSAVFLGVGAIALVALTTNVWEKINFALAPLEIVAADNGRIIRVPPGGDLQAAINRAQSGDTIELQAGATYRNEIKLPKKALTDYITIRSSAANQLPENKRVNPQDAPKMARIVTRGKGEAAITTADGAHHYRFVGIEFAPDSADYIYNLIYLNTDSRELADVPRFLEFDRCYFHPHKSGITRRGIAVNAADVTIKNSYLAGFAGNQEETQAIAGWSGSKNIKIINNYLEAGAETVLFGGSDPASAELIPSDIEIRGNYFFKPAGWLGKFTVKNAFEIKNAKRVEFVGNFLDNNYNCSAFWIMVRNENGKAPFSTIEDVLIKDNVIVGASEGIGILGTDDRFPSQTLKRLTIINNLFLDITNKAYPGGGFFVQISGGEDVLIANNTAFNEGNLTSFYGNTPKNFVFRDNVAGHGAYGIHGHENIKSTSGQRMFQNNVIVNNRKVSQGDTSYPAGNFWVQDYKDVGFADMTQKDFRLSANSRFKGKGSNLNLADYEKIKTN